MSIVSVHGPNMWGGTGAGGGGTGQVITAPQVQATADQTNGLKFTYVATNGARPAADYSWAFPPDGTPATSAANKGPITVTYAAGGSKTATLTVAAGAGPPAGGAYPITVTALTAGPRMVEEGVDAESQSAVVTEDEHTTDVQPGFDPAAHTVAEVEDYVLDHPDEIETILDMEEEGKNRSTLVAYLEAQLDAE